MQAYEKNAQAVSHLLNPSEDPSVLTELWEQRAPAGKFSETSPPGVRPRGPVIAFFQKW